VAMIGIRQGTADKVAFRLALHFISVSTRHT
jgi:hypothetical protein